MRAALLFAVALVLTLPTSSSASPRISRRLVGAHAQGVRARAGSAALARRFECLGLTVERTLADGLPLERSAGARARPSPFDIDPERVWLVAAADSAAAAAGLAALAEDPAIAWAEPLRMREPALAWLAPGFPDDPLYRDTRQWGL